MPFNGSFLDNYIEDAMPSFQVQFACMIEPTDVISAKMRFFEKLLSNGTAAKVQLLCKMNKIHILYILACSTY